MRTNVETLSALAPRWRPDVAILYQMSLDVSYLSNRFLAGGSAAEQNDAGGRPGRDAGPSWPVRLIESTTSWALLKANVTMGVVPGVLLYLL